MNLKIVFTEEHQGSIKVTGDDYSVQGGELRVYRRIDENGPVAHDNRKVVFVAPLAHILYVLVLESSNDIRPEKRSDDIQ